MLIILDLIFFNMSEKRPFSGESFFGPLEKRVRRVERRAALNKPEMKNVTIEMNALATTGGTLLADNTVTLLQPCRIAEGTGINERIGDKIRVWRIEVRGVADVGLDQFLIQCHTTSTPGISSFSNQIGCYLLGSETNKRFTEWLHYRNYYTSAFTDNASPVKFQQKFRNGIIVKYNNALSTGVVDNEVVYAACNRSGGNRVANLTLRMWYTDA